MKTSRIGQWTLGLSVLALLVITAGRSSAERPITFSSNPVRCETDCGVTLTLAQGLSGTLRVYDLLGNIRLERTVTASAGTTEVTWDLRDESGDDVASGMYQVALIPGTGSAVLARLLIIR